MATLDELNIQNHKLTESANVLVYLLQERSMCDTETACHLLYGFLDQVDNHMKLVDSLYKDLLIDKKREVNNTAQMFMSGERELKRIISQYINKWCRKERRELRVADHQEFTRNTRELFEMVLSRIQDETEHLYPLIREVQKNAA